MPTQPLVIVELDRLLARDPQGLALQTCRAKLAAAAKQTRLALDQGVSGEAAAGLRSLLRAYAAGSDLLPSLWSKHQQERT